MSKNKRVLITGGASGLGLALARGYKNSGYDVTILDVVKSKEFTTLKCDLSQFKESILKKCKPFAIVICNAGISVSGNFIDMDFTQEKKVFDTNVFGHIQLVRSLLKKSLILQGGSLAFVSSGTQMLPFPIAISYAASKGALDSFAHALEPYAHEWDISITRIFPGPMKTPHAQYYKGFAEGKGVEPEKLVRPIMRGIAQRRQKVYPDIISKILRITAPLIPRILVRKMHSHYKPKLYRR